MNDKPSKFIPQYNDNDPVQDYFTPLNLFKVANFFKSIGFGDVKLTGGIELSTSDYVLLKQRLVELEMRKPDDSFERIDSVPISYRITSEPNNERLQN